MGLIAGFAKIDEVLKHPVVTIGNFDGFHLGHQKIVQLAIQEARLRGGQAIAFTFRPHPQVILRPQGEFQLLSTYDEKAALLSDFGVDVVIEEPFNREFSETSSNTFFNEILLKRIGVEAIVVGYDFAFGKGRTGHLESLKQFCDQAGVSLQVVPPHQVDGEVVSSSRIREHLKNGNLPAARGLLGRNFSYQGTVIRGEGRGRKLGFPTANLEIESKLALPLGVYVTEVWVGNSKYRAVTNVGVRPTFHSSWVGSVPLVEAHLLGVSLDLYGQRVQIHFIEKLRDEKKFSTPDALKLQISEDAKIADQVLRNIK
ncbi:MAG: bifunctional riboflavin kinase/FAD synthetase [Bdellovibrio sp.]|nr:bifunctional riboflavin kinase/FAD synthetase [Bdellovibrio sp.]